VDPATSLGDEVTSPGVMDRSLVAMDTTLSLDPTSPGGMDERHGVLVASLGDPANALLLRDPRRVQEGTSPSSKAERLSS
jgi:hypothetical protein